MVILASSILSLDAVLGSLPVQRLRRSTLFVDVLSVKEFPKRLMLSALPPEVLLCASCHQSKDSGRERLLNAANSVPFHTCRLLD